MLWSCQAVRQRRLLLTRSVERCLPSKLNLNFAPWQNLVVFQIAPGNLGVVYQAAADTAWVVGLYMVPTVGGTSINLYSEILVPGGDVKDFNIAPDSRMVLYEADREVNDKTKLYVVYDKPYV
jgi:hypothetical protein